jgi:hypothetical protein
MSPPGQETIPGDLWVQRFWPDERAATFFGTCRPCEITRHGRREFVLMSADHYDWLIAASKRTHRTAETPDVVLNAIERAQMDPKHAALDELLK